MQAQVTVLPARTGAVDAHVLVVVKNLLGEMVHRSTEGDVDGVNGLREKMAELLKDDMLPSKHLESIVEVSNDLYYRCLERRAARDAMHALDLAANGALDRTLVQGVRAWKAQVDASGVPGDRFCKVRRKTERAMRCAKSLTLDMSERASLEVCPNKRRKAVRHSKPKLNVAITHKQRIIEATTVDWSVRGMQIRAELPKDLVLMKGDKLRINVSYTGEDGNAVPGGWIDAKVVRVPSFPKRLAIEFERAPSYTITNLAKKLMELDIMQPLGGDDELHN